MYETLVTVVGRLITPVDFRKVGGGVSRASFRIACNERRRDWSGDGGWVDGDTFYLSVTCWRGLADSVATSLHSGDPVVARGRLYTRHYETEGRRASVTELDASAVGPDLARCAAAVVRPPRQATNRTEQAAVAVEAAVEAVDAERALTTGPVSSGPLVDYGPEVSVPEQALATSGSA